MQILNLLLVQGQVSKLSLSMKFKSTNGVLGVYTSNRNSEDTLANVLNNLGIDSWVDQDIATAKSDDSTTIRKEGAGATLANPLNNLGINSQVDQDIAAVKDNDTMTIRKEGTSAMPLAMPPKNQDGTMGVETDNDMPHLTCLLDQKDWSDDDNDYDYEEGQEESSEEEEDGEEEDREEEEDKGGGWTKEECQDIQEWCDIIGMLVS